MSSLKLHHVKIYEIIEEDFILQDLDTISYSSDGRYYALRYFDSDEIHNIGLFDYENHEIANFSNFSRILFSNFDNKFVIFDEDNLMAQIYKLVDNNKPVLLREIAPVKSVYFNPHYEQIAVLFIDNSAKFYDQNWRVKLKLKNVESISYNATGNLCAVVFTNQSAHLYGLDEQNKLSLYRIWREDVVKVLWHHIKDDYNSLTIYGRDINSVYLILGSYLLDNLYFYQYILTTYITNLYLQTKKPVVLKEKYVKLLPDELVVNLRQIKYLAS